MPGKIIAMKVYEGNRTREVGFMMTNHIHPDCFMEAGLEAAKFHQKAMYDFGLDI